MEIEKIIQLKHPAGKNAVSIDKVKYEVLKVSLLNCLKTKGGLTHTEILQSVIKDFKKNKIKFDGSVEWHLEWVKLDLEARKVIKRIGIKPQIKFAVVK
ncbi:MAG: hypothetical protein AAB255_00205 [Bacteroidota bacterium]